MPESSAPTEAKLIAALAACDLLEGLDDDALSQLIAQGSVRTLTMGEHLIEGGAINKAVYLVLAGRLKVMLTPDAEVPLAILEAGESVGELSVIDQQVTSATVIADSTTQVMEIPEGVLWDLVRQYHAVAVNLLQALAFRLRRGNNVIFRIQELLREYEYDATVDPLTGLYNRRWLDRTLPRLMQRAQASTLPMSVLMMDIDAFKHYNDSNGHLAGDRALLAVARCLSLHLRPGDALARFGGEEICALLPGSDADAAHVIAERLRKAVVELGVDDGRGGSLPGVTISIGLANVSARDQPDDLLGRADAALYRAKQAGRNRVER